MAMADLTKFEMRIFKWICLEDNDFVNNPWDTKNAAKAFKVDEEEYTKR